MRWLKFLMKLIGRGLGYFLIALTVFVIGCGLCLVIGNISAVFSTVAGTLFVCVITIALCFLVVGFIACIVYIIGWIGRFIIWSFTPPLLDPKKGSK